MLQLSYANRFLIFLFILGACFGSFLCCQVRRLHLRSAKPSKNRTKPSKNHTKPSSTSSHQSSQLGSRSICLHCGRQLKWYDNLPIISWLILRGKCRHCHHAIGLAEILAELGTAIAFLVLGTTISVESIGILPWITFVSTLMLTVILIFLAIHDGIYGELPAIFLAMAIALAAVVLIFKTALALTTAPFTFDLVWRPLASVAILGGLYLILYLVSKGKWIGDGDWLLGVAIGLALGDPWLSFIALFLANLLACLIMAPTVLKRKRHQIYFGPFLVIAYIIVCASANFLQTLIH